MMVLFTLLKSRQRRPRGFNEMQDALMRCLEQQGHQPQSHRILVMAAPWSEDEIQVGSGISEIEVEKG